MNIEAKLVQMYKIEVEYRTCGCCQGDEYYSRHEDYETARAQMVKILATNFKTLIYGGHTPRVKIYKVWVLVPELPPAFSFDEKDSGWDELTTPDWEEVAINQREWLKAVEEEPRWKEIQEEYRRKIKEEEKQKEEARLREAEEMDRRTWESLKAKFGDK